MALAISTVAGNRILRVGTGNPELTIDRQTNQKVLEYRRQVTKRESWKEKR